MKQPIKAIVFDVYGTLFDVHSVRDACEQEFPEKGAAISQVWRTKQLEYFFWRHMMGRYEDFESVTRDALRYALAVHDATSTEDIEQRLVTSYAHLTPYEEVESVLKELHDVKTVILSNGTDEMLKALLRNAGLTDYFDEVVSVDGIKQPKPTPAAYMHWFKTSVFVVTRCSSYRRTDGTSLERKTSASMRPGSIGTTYRLKRSMWNRIPSIRI